MKSNDGIKSSSRIEELKGRIRDLNYEIASCEFEINKLLAEEGADFKGSYVMYYDKDTYLFMSVEQQILRGGNITLQGPTIELDENPLAIKNSTDEEIQFGTFDEDNTIMFSAKVLTGTSATTIRKITHEEMTQVFDYWARTMKEKLFG